jgi:hypothetical protein
MAAFPAFLNPPPQVNQGRWQTAGKDMDTEGCKGRKISRAAAGPETVRDALNHYARFLPSHGLTLISRNFEPSKMARGGSAYLRGDIHARNGFVNVAVSFSREGAAQDSQRASPFDLLVTVCVAPAK